MKTILIIIGVIVVVGLALVLLSRCTGISLPYGSSEELPVDLQKIIPTSWDVLEDQYKPCDFDSDGETEWLIIYNYDTSVGLNYNLVGGVVYDAQVNRVPQAPSDLSPYRPALLIPYKLLPDIYTKKGQGYLGETSVAVSLYPPEDKNACRGDEIIVQGFSGGGFPTRLSIFRWEGAAVGYPAEHFVGNARVVFSAPPEPITEVTTYNRLNDRSALCDVQYYSRPPASSKDQAPPLLKFTRHDTTQTIDFCFGPPNDPAYPEGVVAALLRGNSPKDAENNPSPTGATYLTLDATLSPGLEGLKGPTPTKHRVLSLTNQGVLGAQPAQGHPCDPASVVPGTWWCGQETAEVLTEIELSDGQKVRVKWQLTSIASDKVNADVHWRIERAIWD